LADLPAGNAGSDLGDLARHVEADHYRQRHLDARHAAHREHVVVVERRRPHADHHVTRDGGGERMVAHDLELVEAAVLARTERFQGLVAAPRVWPFAAWIVVRCRSKYFRPRPPTTSRRFRSASMRETFRQFLDRLRQSGELVDLHQPVDIRHIATLVDQADTALYFHNVIGYELPVVSGLIRTRERSMMALGCETYREIEDKLT